MNSGPRKHGVAPPEVAATIEAFFGVSDWEGLWLSGGTCLSEYYFGHRVSVDVDLLTADERLFAAARDLLRRPAALKTAGTIETVRTDVHLCQFLLRCRTGGVVKVDLVLDLPIALGPKVRCGRVWLDSLPDLAANKMGCLIQREDPKDYVDLFFLLPCLGLGTKEALELGLKKDAGLDPLLLAEQVRYIEDRPRPDSLRTDTPWEQVLYFFRRMREDLLRLIEPRRT